MTSWSFVIVVILACVYLGWEIYEIVSSFRSRHKQRGVDSNIPRKKKEKPSEVRER